MRIGATTCGCLSRRGFMAGAAGAAAIAGARAQERPFRIDVHHHLAPPGYIAALSQRGPAPAILKDWTPQRSLDDMDAAGIGTAMLSITVPGLWFGDDANAAKLARLCNEYAAGLGRDHPGRFGSFAALPMPDIDASLREIEYALDTLGADGVAMFTDYGDKWLGDPSHAPVFEELNRRKAVLYTHPTAANCCNNLIAGVTDPTIEYGTDTTRAIAKLLFGGFVQRYPDIRAIFSHAGGTMPFLIERFEFQAAQPAYRAAMPGGAAPLLRHFSYDTAQASNPAAMGALAKLVPVSQVLFGTDYPYRTGAEHVRNLAGCGFSPAELRSIERGNAAAMLPRFA